MKTYVIGNSIVRELTDSGWTTICLPGADWSAIVHYVTLHRESLANSIIYVHIGPVRFTRLTNRHECVLRSRYIDDPPTLFRSWRSLIQSHNIIPVICTIYPMDFDRYNEHLKSKRNSHHIRQDLYSDYNKRIKGMAVVENQKITDFNVYNKMATPYMHKRVFTRRRHAYSFCDRFLVDGLHPSKIVIDDWIREIKRVNEINTAELSKRNCNSNKH